MKGNQELIGKLNELLSEELTAINQYMVHSEVCENWGFGKLHKVIRKQAFDEMKHAEWLIERILFLEGMPIVSNLKQIKVGKTVPEMIENDKGLESYAISSYNEAIKLARGVNDDVSASLLSKILKDENDHIDFQESQQDQINQMGLENYLSTKVEAGS
jgi:bacterioferritin